MKLDTQQSNHPFGNDNMINVNVTPSTEKSQSHHSQNVKNANVGVRFLAYIIDILIVFSINGVLLFPFKFINSGAPIDIGYWSVKALLAGMIYYLYFLFMTRAFSQTLGKMIFQIQVVKVDGTKLTWGDLFFREVIGRFIQKVFKILYLLYIIVFFTENHQGVHDMFAHTKVIRATEDVSSGKVSVQM